MQAMALMGDQLDLDFEDLTEPDPHDTVLAKLGQLEQLIAAHVALGERLWDLKVCASYFGCSQMTARRILERPGAPRPIRIPTSKSAALPSRWVAEEIKQYATVRSRLKRGQ